MAFTAVPIVPVIGEREGEERDTERMWGAIEERRKRE